MQLLHSWSAPLFSHRQNSIYSWPSSNDVRTCPSWGKTNIESHGQIKKVYPTQQLSIITDAIIRSDKMSAMLVFIKSAWCMQLVITKLTVTWSCFDVGLLFSTFFWSLQKHAHVILCLHYVPGGHGGHVSDNREQNGITVRQRRGTG